MNSKKLKNNFKILFSLFLWLNTFSLFAQTEKPIENAYFPTESWLLGQVDYQFSKGANIYFQAFSRLAFSEEGRLYNKNNSLLVGNTIRLGAEQPISEKSLLGVQAQSAWENDVQTLFLRPYFLRYAKIKKLTFGQRFLFEYKSNIGNASGKKSFLGGMIFLTDDFMMLKKKTTWFVGFEVYKDLTKKNLNEERRFFAQTRWLLNLEYHFKPQLAVGIFSQFVSNYFFALALYDQNGKEIKPDRRLNLHSPILGVSLRYRFSEKTTDVANFPFSLIF